MQQSNSQNKSGAGVESLARMKAKKNPLYPIRHAVTSVLGPINRGMLNVVNGALHDPLAGVQKYKKFPINSVKR